MKRILTLAIVLLFLLPACHKKGVSLFKGDYSYKMSGSVDLKPADSSGLFTLHFNVTNEIGSLVISPEERGSDSVMVAINAVNGEVIATKAFCNDNEIKFADFDRLLRITDIAQGINTNCKVTVEARGTMYDDNTMVVSARFSGSHTYLGSEYDVKGDDIVVVAYRNE